MQGAHTAIRGRIIVAVHGLRPRTAALNHNLNHNLTLLRTFACEVIVSNSSSRDV